MKLRWCNLRRLVGCHVALFPAIAVAQTLVVNGSFELGIGQPGPSAYVSYGVGSSSLTGWTIFGDELAVLNGSFLAFGDIGTVPSDGTFYLDLAGITDAAPHGGVQQGISTVPGQAYRLNFDLGTGTGASSGAVSLLASAGATTATFTNFNTVANWTTFSLDFTASSTTTLIALQGVSTPAGHWLIGLDNVSVIPVPEPPVVALTALGLGVLGLSSRRRRQRERAMDAG